MTFWSSLGDARPGRQEAVATRAGHGIRRRRRRPLRHRHRQRSGSGPSQAGSQGREPGGAQALQRCYVEADRRHAPAPLAVAHHVPSQRCAVLLVRQRAGRHRRHPAHPVAGVLAGPDDGQILGRGADDLGAAHLLVARLARRGTEHAVHPGRGPDRRSRREPLHPRHLRLLLRDPSLHAGSGPRRRCPAW